MPYKAYIEKLLEIFGVHRDREVLTEKLVETDKTGGGLYEITYVCRFCKRQRTNQEYRREQPVVDLELRREYFEGRNK